jgi:3-mercaptopyruvate sulfurtransferase SseA
LSPVAWKAGVAMSCRWSRASRCRKAILTAVDPLVIKRLTDVLLVSHEGSAQIVDARPAGRFNGQVDEPRPGLRAGIFPAR